LCVPSNLVPFGMSVLREVSQLKRISVLLKGKLRTDLGGMQKTEQATTLSL
jgi:hypothetical protein